MVRSANSNVSTTRVSGVFSHFCRARRLSALTMNTKAKVKLTLAGNVVRLRRNAVSMRDRGNGNDDFVVALGLNGKRFRRRRVSLGRRVVRRRRPTRPNATTVVTRTTLSGSVIPARPSSAGVLVMRSSTSVHRVLTRLFQAFCRIVATSSNMRTLRLMRGRVPDVILDSIIVPHVSKARLYGRVGNRFGAYRVPMILLATEATIRRAIRKLHLKTSSCVAGPFGVGVLISHYGGLIGSHVRLRRGFAGRPRTFTRVLTAGPVSGRVLSHTVRVVRGCLSSSAFGIGAFTHRVKVTHAGLFDGLGTMAKRAPGSFVLAVHLGGNTIVLQGGPRLGVARVSSGMKFSSSQCFDGYFGSMCRIDPVGCQGKRRKRSSRRRR